EAVALAEVEIAEGVDVLRGEEAEDAPVVGKLATQELETMIQIDPIADVARITGHLLHHLISPRQLEDARVANLIRRREAPRPHYRSGTEVLLEEVKFPFGDADPLVHVPRFALPKEP